MIRAKLSNGSVMEFPDDTPDHEVDRAVAARMTLDAQQSNGDLLAQILDVLRNPPERKVRVERDGYSGPITGGTVQ